MEHTTIDKAIFAQRLSELLEASSETTYSLAEKLSLSPGTISRYANGLMAPKITTIRAIADVFGVNTEWLKGQNAAKFSSSRAISDLDPQTEEFASQFSRLSPDDQKLILAAMKGMIKDEE